MPVVADDAIKYVDHLQRKNAEALGFYPKQALEKAITAGAIVGCYDNAELAGYLWRGAINPNRDLVIYQACVDYSSRRKALGAAMVSEIVALADAGKCAGVRLRCASSIESNQFWLEIGFYCFAVTEGGKKRARHINHYRMDLLPLDAPESVAPSTEGVNLKAYQKAKRDGVEQASRFSRSHYGEIIRGIPPDILKIHTRVLGIV